MGSFCIFGGYDGTLQRGQHLHVTIFGGLELARPPMAHLIAEQRQNDTNPQKTSEHWFLTLFGATEISWPPLAEEYLALRQAIDSGTLSWHDWDRCLGNNQNDPIRTHALTLFGGFDDHSACDENKEIETLSLQQHLGQIPANSASILMHAIGQTGVPRLATVRQAVAVSLTPST